MSKLKISDTEIRTAGLFRCCIGNIQARGTAGESAEIGDVLKCPDCDECVALSADGKGGGVWVMMGALDNG